MTYNCFHFKLFFQKHTRSDKIDISYPVLHILSTSPPSNSKLPLYRVPILQHLCSIFQNTPAFSNISEGFWRSNCHFNESSLFETPCTVQGVFKKYYVHNLPLLVSPLYIPTYIHPQSLPTSQNPLFECASLSLYPSFSVFLIRTQLRKYRL